MQGSGIYKIQSIHKPERFYIGSAVNISHRWDHHLYDLRRNKHGSSKLQRHYNKYGECDLQFSVVLGCEKEYLIANEQFFIDSYKPYFNSRINAHNNWGLKFTEEHKQRMREANMGKHVSEETKQKLREIAKKQWENPEYRKRMSELKLGKPSGSKGKKRTDESRKRMSDSQKGRIAWNKGKKLSDDYRKKLSESHRGQRAWNKGLKAEKPPWNKGKRGVMKAWNKGKHYKLNYIPTPEHIEKIKESKRRNKEKSAA